MTAKIKDDGDNVRGLGFVTLHAAYLEEQLDSLLCLLAQIEDVNDQRWPTKRKIKQAKRILKRLTFVSRNDMIKNLCTCVQLFNDRNEVVHGRIYASLDPKNRFDTLKSGRSNIPDRPIRSAELYELANEFNELRLAIMAPMLFEIPRAINEHLRKISNEIMAIKV